MLTGDRVVLRTDATGRTTASMTPDSPHYGRPVEYVDAGAHTWVVPKLAPRRGPVSTLRSSTSGRCPAGPAHRDLRAGPARTTCRASTSVRRPRAGP